MIYGITRAQCVCMCACEFPSAEATVHPRGTARYFETRPQAVRWAKAQKTALEAEGDNADIKTSVRKDGNLWMAEVTWNRVY